VNHLEEENGEVRVMSYTTFVDLWKTLYPQLKFQKPGSDLCEVCTSYKDKMKAAKNEEELFNNLKKEYDEHVAAANLEREHYNNNIELSKHNMDIAHICYDWAQNVTIPSSPQQIGAMYFKSGFATHIFGVCKTEGGTNYQLNYLIGEDEFPQGVGKGGNTTLNMVYHALNKFARIGKKELHITCDNCSGQNKNNLSLWFWAYLIMNEWYETITVNFMIPGHTKFLCDAFFGSIKKVYRDHKINTIDDIQTVVNKSARGNEAIRFNQDSDWTWYNFTELFEGNFVNFPHIKKYQHFRFSSLPDDIGKVYASKKSGSEEISYRLLKNDYFDKNTPLNIIPVQPLTEKRRKYLFTTVRNHVDEEFRDVHFSEF
jgi:hypothetical protein